MKKPKPPPLMESFSKQERLYKEPFPSIYSSVSILEVCGKIYSKIYRAILSLNLIKIPGRCNFDL